MRFSRKERKGRKERIDKMKKQTKTIFVTSLAFAAVGAAMMLQEERS